MQHFQDTETGQIHAFDDGVDPFKLGYRSIPKTLSATIVPQPSEDHVWFKGGWIHKDQAPPGYEPPVSSVPSYDPAWHFLLTPYTWVLKDGEEFSVSLAQINANTYAGHRLAEPVTAVMMDGAEALVSRDGTVALPMQGDFVEQHYAVELINRWFCALLIGGIYAESVAHNDALVGSLGEDRNLFLYAPTQHGRFRHMNASIGERIELLHLRVIRVAQLHEALAYGTRMLDRVQSLSPFFLLHGYTALQHQNLREALSALWISVEQLTSFIWEKKFLADASKHPNGMQARLQSLKQDNRTWSISVKHEILWQLQLLPEDDYARLGSARRQRNNLLHEGRAPELAVVMDLWTAVCNLLATASGESMEKLLNMGHWAHQPSTRVGKTNFDSWNAVVRVLSS